MESQLKDKTRKKAKRLMRVRKNLRGTSNKPRLSVFRSNAHVYAQVINDLDGKTIVGMGTCAKEFKDSKGKSQTELSKIIGAKIAEKLKEQKIESVIFDRGSYKYHGIIAALADAVREAGIKV